MQQGAPILHGRIVGASGQMQVRPVGRQPSPHDAQVIATMVWVKRGGARV